MSVFRVEKNKDYTTMSNYHLRETKMSLKAVGLLSKMLSLPDEWDYSLTGLIAICKENETAIKSALDELKEFGYLETIKKMPNETSSGRIEYEYIIYEKPKQEGEKQGVEFQGVEFQPVENQPQLNTKQSNTKQEETNNIDYIVGKENLTIKSNQEKILAANVKCIIDYLNETAGTKYKYTTKWTIKLIKARFNDGYSLDDFYDVIDNKWKDWKNTEWQKYIRPETLFGSKFENYLNGKVFNGKAKASYSSKPNFDNTADRKLPKAVSSMTKEERKNFEENELAKDENGNFIKF